MANEARDSLARLERAMREQAAETGFTGLRIQRANGALFVENTLTLKEHAEWRARAVALRTTLEPRMLELVDELERLLLQYQPLDCIAHSLMINALHDAEHWSEHESMSSDAYTEYVALLCLSHTLTEFATPTVEGATGPNAREVNDMTRRLFELSALEDQLEPATRSESPTGEDALRFKTLLHELGVRYPGSTKHLHEVLGEFLQPLSSEMHAAIGFDVAEAIALDRGIWSLSNERLLARIQAASAFATKLRRAVKKYRQKGKSSEPFDKRQLADLAALRPSEAAGRIQQIAGSWAFLALGTTLSFTAADLARLASVGEREAKAFLDFLSIEFGAVPRFFRLPRPAHPLQARPIIRTQSGVLVEYFCPIAQGVGWAIRPRLEESIAGTHATMASAYTARRSDYCEQKAFDLVSALLRPRPGFAYRRAKYRRLVDGVMAEFEIDGVFLLDNVLVLMEAKSGGMRASARRGGRESMRSGLERLIGDAAQQTEAAWSYLSTSDCPVLLVDGERQWRVPTGRIQHVLRICVTLEDLTVFATNLHVLESEGILSLAEPFWAVSIYDLLVVRDFVPLPALFVHYLLRRHATEKTHLVDAYDELDYLASYMATGLRFDELLSAGEGRAHITLDPTHSHIIDDWYYFLEGQRRTRPPKPERQIPKGFRDMLESLERDRPEGYLAVSCALLDLPDAAHAALASSLAQMRSRCEADGKDHDLTVLPPDSDIGITLLVSPTRTGQQVATRLKDYCVLKKHQSRRNHWIGLGALSCVDEAIQIVVVLDEPWRENPQMDALVERTLPPGGTATGT